MEGYSDMRVELLHVNSDSTQREPLSTMLSEGPWLDAHAKGIIALTEYRSTLCSMVASLTGKINAEFMGIYCH
jgi:hypothetical protein